MWTTLIQTLAHTHVTQIHTHSYIFAQISKIESGESDV